MIAATIHFIMASTHITPMHEKLPTYRLETTIKEPGNPLSFEKDFRR